MIIFARCVCGATAAGAGAPALAGRPAVPPDNRRETRDIANGCEAGPGLRRGPRPHSGCRPETGLEDDRPTNPSKNLLRNSRYCRSNGGSARQFRDRQATGRYSCESLWKKGCEGPRGTPTGAGLDLEAVVARQVLERRFRSRAEMLDDLGGGERPKPR